jgi:S1-C subfamily serine protease
MQFRAFVSSGLVLAALLAPQALGDDLDGLGALDAALPRLSEKVSRSVVALEIQREDKPGRPLTPREKLGVGIMGGMRYDERYFLRPAGAVSGVVIASSKDSTTIATSIWNVLDSKSIAIALPSGEKVKATLKGRDENLDVAVLVTEKPLASVPAIPLAKERKVGQFALLVGRGGEQAHPIVTVGNVSAIGRFKGDALQVSTRMNYGNVGGAVVDLDGNLLGIASKLTNRPMQGLNSGVGFAAPVDKLQEELDKLLAGKVIPRRKGPFLGIMARNGPQPEAGIRINLARQVLEGGRLGEIIPGTAALKAGLKDGDIIKIFNGVEIKDFEQLRDSIEKLEPKEKVIVTIERGDMGERDFTIELGERPEGEE